MPDPYALLFEPILKEKIWGGRRLRNYGKAIGGSGTEGPKFGESWEIADLAATSTSGGGGGAAVSVISNGEFAGQTIADAIGAWGAALLGEAGMERARLIGEQTGAGRAVFPLLVKYLDAGEHLSVQVHPSPAYAEAHPVAHLKTESWFVIQAERAAMPDGSTIDPSVFVGLKAGVSRESFCAAIQDGTAAELLRTLPARPGECCTLPSGTVHALGAGVLVAEVQTPSDTTFRVYDWVREYSRPERELHIEQAMACINFDGKNAQPGAGEAGADRAAETDFYTMDSVPGAIDLPGDRMSIVMVHGGAGRLTGAGDPVDVGPGTTVLVPASIAGNARLEDHGSLKSLIIGLGG